MTADRQTLASRPASLDTFGRMVDGLARRRVHAVLAQLSRGQLTLVDAAGSVTFGRADDGLAVTVEVRDPGVYRSIIFGGSVSSGEAYMAGAIACSDLVGLARILTRNIDVLDAMDSGVAGLLRGVREAVLGTAGNNTRNASRRNIAYHYDLSNDFFRLFLDDSMTYSSAIFERDDASLAEAQRTKLDRICQRLDLRPGERLLEIGTGWGALAIHAAKHYGCHVTTTTISPAQHRFASERVHAEGLDDRVTVLQRDYRDLVGRFDKLVSIEMVEAVGHRHLDDYLRACSDRLNPQGRMLLQAITISDQHHARHRESVDFIKAYIFPGSCIPSVTSLVTSATRATDLRLAQLDDLTPHYARTLRCWRERFLGSVNEVRRLGFDDAFVRMWEFYLAYCEGGFEERYLGCVHMLFNKPQAR